MRNVYTDAVVYSNGGFAGAGVAWCVEFEHYSGQFVSDPFVNEQHADWQQDRFNPLTPTVAIWIQL